MAGVTFPSLGTDEATVISQIKAMNISGQDVRIDHILSTLKALDQHYSRIKCGTNSDIKTPDAP